ncbi:MAG: hypothetical protein U1F34_01820 [Gammaproteobacteria bacterium]
MQLLGEDLQRQFLEIDELMTRQERLSEELRNSTRRIRMLRRRRGCSAPAPGGKRSRAHGWQASYDEGHWRWQWWTRISCTLTEPLMHAIRNAVDHGIEKAEERRASESPTTPKSRSLRA